MDLFLKNANFQAGNYEKALKETFLGIDVLLVTENGRKEIQELNKESNAMSTETPSKRGFGGLGDEGPEMKGCTANVVFIKNRTIYTANAGDSRAVLGKKGKAIDLSVDHKPDNKPELTRIEKAGGSVIEGRVDGNLNLSRALGDLRYKKDKKLKPEEQMISAEPEITKYEITSDFDFIVIGCDGIYETKSSQEIIDFYTQEFKMNPTASSEGMKKSVEKYLDMNISPDYIKTEGAGCDNMSCILIKFKPL